MVDDRRVDIASHARRLLVFRNAFSHPRRQRLLGVTQVVGHLQVHPEFRRRFEKRSQPDRRVPCDASFILQNRGDLVGSTPIVFASAFALRPFQNSSLRTSPGGTGRIPLFLILLLLNDKSRFQRHAARHLYQVKQIRHCLLIRILYCPALSPDNSSNLLGSNRLCALRLSFPQGKL